MTCGEARELMLEAEPASLEGTDGSPLARHLAQCASCREAAALILADTASLERAIAAPRHARRRLGAGALVPVALAAAAAAILLVRPQQPEGLVLRADTRSSHFVVSGNAAIIQTRNPDITVLWLF